jgi:hypothetical protein
MKNPARTQHDPRPLFSASPPQRQPLTDTEIEAIYFEHWMNYEDLHIAKQFARAIEAAHGIGDKT